MSSEPQNHKTIRNYLITTPGRILTCCSLVSAMSVRASRGRESPRPSSCCHGSSFLSTQTRSTLTLTYRAHHQTARVNWWVSIRKRSLVPKASTEEPKQLLILNPQEVLGGGADRNTAVWLPTTAATAARPQPMMVCPVGFNTRAASLLALATKSAKWIITSGSLSLQFVPVKAQILLHFQASICK